MFFAVTNRFLHWMVIGLISPILILLMLSKHMTLPQSGIVLSVLSVFVVLFELPSGILSDKIGRKKIYLLSQLGFLTAFVLLLFADSFFFVLCAFVPFGMARAFSSGSIEADFVDNYLKKNDGSRLGQLMSGMGIGETLGLATGALIGGYLPKLARVMIPEFNEFSLNIVLQIILTIILLSTTMAFHDLRHEDKHVGITVFLKDAFGMIRRSVALRLLLVGAFVWGFAFLAIELYWQPRLKELLIDKTDTAAFGYLNSLYFIFAAIGTLAIERILTKYKLNNLYAIIALRSVLGIFLISLAFQNTLVFFSAFYLLIMGANGMLSVPESTMLNLAIPDDKRSSLLSLSSLLMQLGGIFSSLIFSSIVSSAGIPAIWVVSGLLFSSSALIFFMSRKRIRSR